MTRVSGKDVALPSRHAEEVRIREAEQARRSTEAAAQAPTPAQAQQGPPPHHAPSPTSPPARARSGAGSREVFAHSSNARPGTRHPVPTPTTKQPARGLATADDRVVVAGAGRLTSAAKRVASAVSMDDKRAAARAAAATVRDVLSRTKDPLAKGAILERSHDALRTIGAGLDTLSGADTKTAVKDLAAAAEAAGPSHVDALARPLARGMPALVGGHWSNRGELIDALKDGVKAGSGALLGAALGRQLRGVDDDLARDVEGAVGKGLAELRADFEGAAKKVATRDGELAAVASQWGSALSPAQIAAGTRAFHNAHPEYAERDAQAAALSKALAGVGYAEQHQLGGDLGVEGRATLAQVPELARSEVGARTIGAALTRESRGEQTFLRFAGATPKDARDLSEAIQRSIVVSQGDALAHGDTRGLASALQGAGAVLRDPTTRERFDAFAREVQALPPGLPPDKLALSLARSAHGVVGQLSTVGAVGQMNDVARQLSASAAPGPHVAVALADRTSFRAFGATLGAVCLGYSLQGLRDGADAREAVGVVVNAAGLGSSVAGLVLKNGAPKVLTHGLPVVGYALSAFDTVNALKRGDEVGAVAAAAPLAGALSGAAIGAGTGSFAPGIGTAIGGAVGALVGVSIVGVRSFTEDSPSEQFETSTQTFLQGALQHGGLSASHAERTAHRLRDVNEDFFGAGHGMAAIARRTGEPAEQVLMNLANLDDEQLHQFVKRVLDVRDNGEQLREAQVKVAEAKASPDTIPAFRMNDRDIAGLVDEYRALIRR
jgi:hypothetical protein